MPRKIKSKVKPLENNEDVRMAIRDLLIDSIKNSDRSNEINLYNESVALRVHQISQELLDGLIKEASTYFQKKRGVLKQLIGITWINKVLSK